MALYNYNPYKYLYGAVSSGLDTIIENLPPDPDMDELNSTVLQMIGSSFFSDDEKFSGLGSGSGSGDEPKPVVGILFGPILPSVANNYINNTIFKASGFNYEQISMASNIANGLKNNTIDSLENYFDEVEEQIVMSGLSDMDKSSLYIALTITRGSYDYWLANVQTAAASPWSTYFNSNEAVNYANIPFWISATFLGALSGYAQLQKASMGNANLLKDLGVIAGQVGALIGGLGATSGKIVFKWAQKTSVNFSGLGDYVTGIGGGDTPMLKMCIVRMPPTRAINRNGEEVLMKICTWVPQPPNTL